MHCITLKSYEHNVITCIYIYIYLGDVIAIFVFELNGTKFPYFEYEKHKFIKFKL